jgi:hypothetical protein
MERATCNILYVDRNLREDRYLNKADGDVLALAEWESKDIEENVKLLLDVFGEGLSFFFCSAVMIFFFLLTVV